MVARHYDVNANQVFSWRRLYRDDPSAVQTTLGGKIGHHRREQCVKVFRPRLGECDNTKPVA
jgi:transposase-like protein